MKDKGYKKALRDCIFLNEERFFGICEELKSNDNKSSKS